MPRVTTQSGKTLDEVLQGELFTEGVTRRGDSIVPFAVGDKVEFRGFRDDFLPNGKFTVASVTTIEPASHTNDPHTSKTAAASVGHVARRHRTAILVALKFYGPATGHELAARLELDYIQVAKRLTELHKDGKINRRKVDQFDRNMELQPSYQTRPSPSGRPACVWHLNPLAK